MRRGTDGPLLGIASVALAIGCCAGLPVVASLLGGITVAALLGLAGGTVALVALAGVALLLVRSRARHNACKPPTGRNAS
jgi:hypothetical protein